MDDLIAEMRDKGLISIQGIRLAAGMLIYHFSRPYEPKLAYLIGQQVRYDRLAPTEALKSPRWLYPKMRVEEVN